MNELSENRKRAIRILEKITSMMDNPCLFDNIEHKEIDPLSNEPIEPDGTWYGYEDAITDILDEEFGGKEKVKSN